MKAAILFALVVYLGLLQNSFSVQINSYDAERLYKFLADVNLLQSELQDANVSQQDCNNIPGISCDRDGFVENISIVVPNLNSSIFGNNASFGDSICQLSRLRNLKMSGFGLIGNIPDCLENLTSLETLNLEKTNLAGQIPAGLGKLRNLSVLKLSHNNLSGEIPDCFGNFSSLQVLDLSWNFFSGNLPQSFSALKSLKTLNLTLNFLEGPLPEFIGEMDNLSSLDISFNNFNGSLPVGLGNLKNLAILRMDHGSFSGIIQPLINKLNKLQFLDLSQNFLKGNISLNWEIFEDLETLKMAHNFFSGPLPENLGSLKKLKLLNLRGNKLSGEIPDALGNLQNLEILDLSNNSISGTIPKNIQNLGNNCEEEGCLHSLNLAGNFLRGPLIDELLTLNSLRYLNLKQNQLSGSIPSLLQDLTNLQYLDLSFNSFSGPIPTSLSSLEGLQILFLSNNNLMGPLPSLGNILNLYALDLSYNQFRGTIPNFFVSRTVNIIQLNNNLLEGDINFFSNSQVKYQELVLDDNLFSGVIPTIETPVLSVKNNYFTTIENTTFYGSRLLRISGNPSICSLSDESQASFCSASTTLNFETVPACQAITCPNGTQIDRVQQYTDGSCNCVRFVNLTIVLEDPPFVAVTRSLLLGLSIKFFVWIAEDFGTIQDIVKLWTSMSESMPDGSIILYTHVYLSESSSDMATTRLGKYLLNNEIDFGVRYGQLIATYVSAPSQTQAMTTSNSSGGYLVKNNSNFPVWALLTICIGFVLLVLLSTWVVIVHLHNSPSLSRSHSRRETTPNLAITSTFAQRMQYESIRLMSLEEILIATEDFSDKNFLGSGSYGTVHKGVGATGQLWAVKRNKKVNNRSLEQFQKEVAIVSKVSHINLVKLLGFCDEKGEQILVYEFMSGGTLLTRLHPANPLDCLTFEQRLRIATGIAEGLHYLHTFQSPAIIHRDIKSENILLDENNNAKIGDFGFLKNLADSSSHEYTEAMGTPGYIDPEYYHSLRVTTKSDVYSYGVVLLELISGRKSILKINDSRDSNLQITITNWVVPLVETEQKLDIVDPHLYGQFDQNVMKKLIDIAIDCVQRSSEHRPDMRTVARRLSEIGGQPRSKTMRRTGRATPQSPYFIRIDSGETGDSMCTPPLSGSFIGR